MVSHSAYTSKCLISLNNPVICIVGPTASGKSELAQRLAEHVGGEVVSADSMQIYKGMDIGTGKVLLKDRRVPHWGLDILDIGEPYSAALYQRYARDCFVDISQRGLYPVLCGGTGFYVRAAIDAYDFPEGEQVHNSVRDHYRLLLDEIGPEELWTHLNDVDPQSALLIERNDTKRVIRAFELLDAGTSYARQKQQLASISQAVPAIFVGLQVDPSILRCRIDARVDQMFEMGLINEVKDLLGKGLRKTPTASQAIGYREVIDLLDGKLSFENATQQIKFATHRYAKRQRTWFRKDSRITWIDANSGDMDELFGLACEKLAALDI